ncbi:UMP kinase [Treponema sp.]|uniref:UMP kinase n=1 Tax=Treponema sp. TaxID=166 RepID=UPI00298E0681|nr:UMP kinase [Treponema sp.]MCR5613486.1 UMP kinase [Treponema sp.]
MAVTKVLSVGGSIVVPEKPDTDFLKKFISMTSEWLKEDKDRRLILVVGGGGPARIYQNAYREILDSNAGANAGADNSEADWIGIMATRLNAQLLKASFGSLCPNPVVYNPTENIKFDGQVLVAAGWKPGFSTDNDAVLLAENFNADTVVNLSNIEKVYTDDPRKNPDAKPIDNISWTDFRKMVGDEWVPGKNCPFDPIASKKAQEMNLTVICAAGKNIENIKNILDAKDYVGTTIKG